MKVGIIKSGKHSEELGVMVTKNSKGQVKVQPISLVPSEEKDCYRFRLNGPQITVSAKNFWKETPKKVFRNALPEVEPAKGLIVLSAEVFG